MKLNGLTWVAMILTVVGGINWGLVGLFGFDLVKWLFIDTLNIAVLARVVYVVVGLAAVYLLATTCCACGKGSCSTSN